jgi:hypothetical protein
VKRETAGQALAGWDGHILVLYSREAALGSWVRRGLENDEKVVCTGTDAQLAQRSVLRLLDGQGIDVAGATAEGRLTMLPLPEFCPPGGQAEVLERYLPEGFRRVRATAEAKAVLTFLPARVFAEREESIDLLCRTGPLSAMCQYEQASTVSGRLREVTGSHEILQQRLLSGYHVYRGLVLAGEVDLFNDEVLAQTLLAATRQAVGHVRAGPQPGRLSQRVGLSGPGGRHAPVQGRRRLRAAGGSGAICQADTAPGRVDRLMHLQLAGGH